MKRSPDFLTWLDGASLSLLVATMCSQIDVKRLGRDTLAEGLGYASKTFSVALSDVVFALVVAYFVARTVQMRAWKRLWWPPLSCWALIFALLVSALHSPTILGQMAVGGLLTKESKAALAEIVQWTAYFLVAPWVFVNLMHDRRAEELVSRRGLAIATLGVAALASGLVALIQLSGFFRSDEMTAFLGSSSLLRRLVSTLQLNGSPDSGPVGLFSSANVYCAFMAMVAPLLLEAEGDGPARLQGWVTVLGIFVAAAFLFTGVSLWALLAFIIGAIAAVVTRHGGVKIKAFRLAFVAAFALVALLSWRQQLSLEPFRAPFLSLSDAKEPVKKQFIEWQVATRFNTPGERAFATGFGPGNYQGNIGTLYQYDSIPNEKKMPPDSNNLWLVQAVSIGVLGLGALVWVVAHFFGLAWRAARANAGDWLGAGVVGSLSAWIFVNFFHALIVRGAGLVLAFVFALAVVASQNVGLGRNEAEDSSVQSANNKTKARKAR